MKKLPYFLSKRKRNFESLSITLADVKNTRVLPQLNDNRFKSSYYCLGLLLDESIRYKREKIMKKLTSRGIGTSSYYPSPLPRMTFYKDKYSYNPESYKNASYISDGIISFPVGPHLSDLEMEFISKEFKQVMEELNV